MDERNFYFALPRLVTRSHARSEKNAVEANAVGLLVQSVAYFFAFEVSLGDASLAKQLLFAIPLAFLVWLFWLLFFYVSHLVLRPFHPQRMAHAQSFSLCSLTTVFAIYLVAHGSWTRWLGIVWLALVVLNLGAAVLLPDE